MYTILMGYLSQLPGAMQERVLPSEEKEQVSVLMKTECGRRLRSFRDG
jgi:hypothetical protein